MPVISDDLRDIKKCEFDRLIADNSIDVVIGGPPCQGFSLANKRRNTIKDDPRNELFYDFVSFQIVYLIQEIKYQVDLVRD